MSTICPKNSNKHSITTYYSELRKKQNISKNNNLLLSPEGLNLEPRQLKLSSEKLKARNSLLKMSLRQKRKNSKKIRSAKESTK